MAKFKENTRIVFDYIKEHEDENITAKDIAAALDLDPRQVNGIITGAFARHTKQVGDEKVKDPLAERLEGELEIEDKDGNIKHESVKFVKLTESGRNFDPETAE